MEHGPVAYGDEWRAWCLKRLDAAGFDTDEGAAVRYGANEVACLVQELNLPPDKAVAVLRIMSHLTAGEDIPDHLSLLPPERAPVRWIDLSQGHIGKGVRVRVRSDAYTGRQYAHNGMQGKIVGIRHGVVAVQYDGMAVGSVVYHDRELLECAV